MKVIEINKVNYNIPESWDEVTFRQLLKLARSHEADTIETIAILLNADYNTIFSLPPQNVDQWIAPFVSFVNQEIDFDKLKVPDEINIYDEKMDFIKCLKVPKNIELKSFGQKIYFQKLMMEERDILDKMPELVAIYLHPEFTGGKFDELAIKEFADRYLMNSCAKEVYAVCNFFLSSWMRLLRKKISSCLRNMNEKNYRQVSESLSNLVI
jgi:hypothetical protein